MLYYFIVQLFDNAVALVPVTLVVVARLNVGVF